MSENQRKREALVEEYRQYLNKVAGWIDAIWTDKWVWIDRYMGDDKEDDYTKSEDCKNALQFYREFPEQEEVDYSEVVTYAKELFEKYEATDKSLDDKADSVIKYLGGGSALVTFGAMLSIKTDNPWNCLIGIVVILCFVPSLVFALLAVRNAIHVRRPRASATPPNVKYALDVAEYYKTKKSVAINLWLIFYPITEAGNYRLLQKAKIVESAHKFYLAAMTFLLLPIIGLVITLALAGICHEQKAKPKTAESAHVEKK